MVYNKKNLNHSIRAFASEFNSKNLRNLRESMSNLIEILENKADPDPEDVVFCDALYQLTENFDKLNYIMGNVLNENSKSLPGNKLYDLYYK